MSENQTDILISFVIPVLNGEKHMAACLDHIIREMGPRDEIIVVDNGSTDRTLDIVRGYARATILQFPEVTIAALRNRGAEVAAGDVLAFIDSDCLVCEGWRAAVVDVLSDPSVHATGSKCDLTPSPTWVEKAWLLSVRNTTRTRCHYFLGANFVVHKEIFKAVGGFNENLVTDEDSEIGTRLVAGGYVLIDEPAVRVIHLGNSKTIRQFARRQKWHATSMLDTMTAQKLDKPLAMTFLFMLCFLASIVALGLFWLGMSGAVLLVTLSLLAAPAATAAYRVSKSGQFVYFPALLVLYSVYYAVRSLAVIQSLYHKTLSRRRTNSNHSDGEHSK